MALILMEDFTLQLVCESTKGGRGDGHFNIITANVLRKTAHGIAKRPKGMNPYTGYICTRASLGLGYNDAAILIAMQTSLLPSPRVPLSETQFAGLGIPSATFVTQPSTDDWEYTGTESSIRICEVSISCTNERGWDIQTEPLSPIALNTTAQLTHLQFVPKYHYDDTSMAIDGASSSQGDRYLVVGTTELGSLTSPPRADISVYSLSKQSPPASTQKWNVHMESKRGFVNYAVFTMAPAYPTYQKGPNLLIVSLLQVYGTESADSDKICLLELPLLEDNGQYRALKLEKREGPSFIGISPQGTHLVLRNSHAQGQLGYDTYPDTLPNDDTPSEVSLRNAILQALTSSQDLDNIVLVLKKLDYEAKLDIVDSAWVLLDSESAGGGAPRWMMDYIKVVLLLDRSVDEGKSSHPNRTNVALNILSLPAAKSALSECHGKDHEASYQPDAVWPLSEICGWIVEFTENILSAASQFQNSNSNGSTAPSIDPALLVLLNQSLVDTWVDSLALVLRFVKHVDVPKGTSTDSKTLVTRSVEDTLSQSPVNISLLTEALKGLRVNESISAADWRNAYRRLALSERIANVAKELVSHVLKPEIVTLLALHVRMAGLNLISDDYTSVERDVITKKPIADGNWPPPLGIGALLGEATDQLSIELGETLGALLNASFGNAVEIIVGVAALLQGQLRIVQTSMLGSILSNILLVLGCAFFAGGLKRHEGVFEATGAQAASSLMTLSCITLIIPAAYHASYARAPYGDPPAPDDGSKHGLLLISRGTSIILLILYGAYLFFQLRTHPDLFKLKPGQYVSAADADSEEGDEEEEAQMNLPAAGLALLGVTLVTSFCADYLVASIEETAERYKIPETFIGIILLPIVANAAEHFTAVFMALKNKMETTIGIAVGSSIQISTLVIPLLVIIGWITSRDLTLFFSNFETASLFVSVLLVNMLIQDGKSNYMEGLMLIGLYLVIALSFWAT
ncbi:hypothetical protein FRC17_009672 [Serendipita sp. 399]|nr:hypothetical protein FRC17_009672 [Serendipita sp. 399]